MPKPAGPVIPEGMTLDPDRDWISTKCVECEAVAHIHNGEGNVVSESRTVMATLPDKSQVPVVVDVDVPAPTLRWVCGNCGKVQEYDVESAK